MKYLSILVLLLLSITIHAQTTLSGKITDADTGEELIAANVTIYKGQILISGIATDFEGNYHLNIDPGTYDVEVSYVGYQSNRIERVVVRAGQANKLDVKLGTGGSIALDEIVVTDYKVPLVQQDNTTQGAVVTSQGIRRFASKSKTSSAASRASQSSNKAAKVRGSNNNNTNAAYEVVAKKEVKTTTKVSALTVTKSNKKKAKKTTTSKPENTLKSNQPDLAAGQLTAGEWKDLDNWTFWQKLMKDWAFSKYKKHWGYSPDQRFAVKLSDEHGRALANITINLLDETGAAVWNSRTDNKGHAELWGNFFSGSGTDFKIEIQQGDYKSVHVAIPYEEGLNSLSLPLDCSVNKQVDVAFVVDATNSMLDEIAYLKAEITDVLQRAEEENDITLRSSAVFYTDRHNPTPYYQSMLTEDHNKTINFIKNQKNSSGGKEWAEAPDLGLAKAIREMDWNEEAIARIVFLMLDAPPHHKEEFLKDLQITIEAAAAKGIKIIPLAASGIKKDAEFILKFFAMATNGTYTFLTDHSGIGNSHIKPEAGSYNIETLNDMLVRLIGESSEYHDCAPVENYIAQGIEKKKLNRKERKDSEIKALIKQIKCFPNPATDFVMVDLGEAIDLLLITDGSGKRVANFPKMEAGQVKLQTSDWAGGLYFFHFYKKGKHVVEKVVISAADSTVKR